MIPPRHWYWVLRYNLRWWWDTRVRKLPRWREHVVDAKNVTATSKAIVRDDG